MSIQKPLPVYNVLFDVFKEKKFHINNGIYPNESNLSDFYLEQLNSRRASIV